MSSIVAELHGGHSIRGVQPNMISRGVMLANWLCILRQISLVNPLDPDDPSAFSEVEHYVEAGSDLVLDDVSDDELRGRPILSFGRELKVRGARRSL